MPIHHDAITRLRLENAHLRRERDTALERRNSDHDERMSHQAATIEVLRAMSASPGDPQPVFEQIVNRVAEVCSNASVALFEFDGSLVHVRAYIKGVIDDEALAAYLALFPMAPNPASVACRAILTNRMVRISDMSSEAGLFQAVRYLGWKSMIALPFRREGNVAGTINANSREADSFTGSQIALLETFAEQAAIAISSAQTYQALRATTSNLTEALNHQAATTEVLKVVSRSTFDLNPVFESVVATSARLCHADQATIYRSQNEEFGWVAGYGLPPAYELLERSTKIRPGHGTLVGRVAVVRRPVQILDCAVDPLYEAKEDARIGGIRTMLGVPLLLNDQVIGVIGLARQRVESYTERFCQLSRQTRSQQSNRWRTDCSVIDNSALVGFRRREY
jgi:two-component system, NtrC family, sensor kinase